MASGTIENRVKPRANRNGYGYYPQSVAADPGFHAGLFGLGTFELRFQSL